MEHGATADGPPALNRQTLQKVRERAYLERFLENFADFPEGEVVSFEHPDFLIRAQPRWIGIEIVEYHIQEPGEDRGSPMRAQQDDEDKVLRRAAEQYELRGLPPVVVNVLWHPHQALGRRRIPELAAGLADSVQENLPEPNRSVTIRSHQPAGRSLPQKVASLTVIRRESITKGSWTPVRAAFAPTIAPPDLQEILRKKEAKVPSYRRHCWEV